VIHVNCRVSTPICAALLLVSHPCISDGSFLAAQFSEVPRDPAGVPGEGK